MPKVKRNIAPPKSAPKPKKKKPAAVPTPVKAKAPAVEKAAPAEKLLGSPNAVPATNLETGQYYHCALNGRSSVFQVRDTLAGADQIQVTIISYGSRQNVQAIDQDKIENAVNVTKEQAFNLSRDPNYYGEGSGVV